MATYQHSLLNPILDRTFGNISSSLTVPALVLEIHVNIQSSDRNQLYYISNQHTANRVSTHPNIGSLDLSYAT